MKEKLFSRSTFLNKPGLLFFGLGAFVVSFALAIITSSVLAAQSAIPITALPDATFQALFESYGNDNTLLDDWTGADGTLSVRLPDGRVIWDFSDTFLGLVNSDK